eukprot:2966237-Prymnesium_polylepis.1
MHTARVGASGPPAPGPAGPRKDAVSAKFPASLQTTFSGVNADASHWGSLWLIGIRPVDTAGSASREDARAASGRADDDRVLARIRACVAASTFGCHKNSVQRGHVRDE